MANRSKSERETSEPTAKDAERWRKALLQIASAVISDEIARKELVVVCGLVRIATDALANEVDP